MSEETHDALFGDTLAENDYGLIVCGKTGALKGLWIPKTHEDDYVPDSIIHLCVNYFGVDPSEFDEEDEDDLGTPPTNTVH